MIEVQYKNTEKQFADFSMYRATSSESYKKAVKKRSYVMSAMFIISGLIYLYMSAKMPEPMISRVISVIFILIGIGNVFVFNKIADKSVRKAIVKNLKEQNEIIGKTFKVKYDGKNIYVSKGKSKEKLCIKMQDILEVINLNNCVCISVRENAGLVIPYDAFKSLEEKDTFEAEIRELLNNK